MNISVITVSYNASDFIERYLQSLKKFLTDDMEVIIVDNHSQDNTIEIIEKYSFVHLIENDENVGFSQGCNLGASQAQGRYYLFLNHDTKVLDNSIKKIKEYLEKHAEVGLVGPSLVEPNGHTQQSISHFPSLWGAIKEYIFQQPHAYTQYAEPGKQPREVDAVYGAAMMLPAEVFKKLGGFNEQYFLFYEDIDLCQRVHKLGLKVIYLPEAEFSHVVGASMKAETKMPAGLRTLSWFWPVKRSGSRYYLLKSAQIYHGFFIATLIRLIIYLSTKVKNLYTKK